MRSITHAAAWLQTSSAPDTLLVCEAKQQFFDIHGSSRLHIGIDYNTLLCCILPPLEGEYKVVVVAHTHLCDRLDFFIHFSSKQQEQGMQCQKNFTSM
eukprot:scaffold17438_cov96-Skeletonema_menzelii.AAC.1